MRFLILTPVVVTIILAFSATDAEGGDDVHVHFHLATGDGEPGEEEQEAKKEDGADYNSDGRNLSPHFSSSKWSSISRADL